MSLASLPLDRGEALLQARAELAACWRRGERLWAEVCLARCSLADDPAALRELVLAELLLRLDRGETPQLEEYLARLPDQQAELHHLFDLVFPGTLTCVTLPLAPAGAIPETL